MKEVVWNNGQAEAVRRRKATKKKKRWGDKEETKQEYVMKSEIFKND